MPRHNKSRITINRSEYYAPLRESRGLPRIVHYDTPIMRNPTVSQRAAVETVRYMWKYGDRLYNLAHKYYGDPGFWWIIAWWNGYGIEGDIKQGAVIRIPLDASHAIKVLGV